MDLTDAKHSTQIDQSMPELVDSIATRTVARLCNLLADMYEHIDDTLFDLADRAYNNSEQALYFESMREIRLHRSGSEQVFRQSLENGFQRLRNQEYQQISHAELEAETLALVDTDEMEIDVAISNMVHRARCDCPAALLQLNTRLNTILPHDAVNEDSNPLDPKSVVRAFTQATQDLELDIKLRLILYKEFEKHVLWYLDEVLLDANQVLIDAGILPDIRATLSRGSTTPKGVDNNTQAVPRHEQPATASGVEPDESHSVRFDTLQSLLAATTDNLQEASVYLQSDPAQPALDQQALFNWLNSIQQQQLEQSRLQSAPQP